MTTLYLLRHGQSISNATHVCAGTSDYELSELGFAQAEAAAEVLAQKPITAIYSSPLSRAYHTACAVAKRLELPITIHPNLREHHAGEWETLSFDEIPLRYPENRELWRTDPENNPIIGGEAVPEVRRRMTEAIQAIAAAHDGEHVLIASHASALRMFFSGIRGTPFRHSDPDLANTSISTVTYENGVFTIREIGNADHLTDALRGIVTDGILPVK